jgi:hypothetical protein
VPSKLTKGERDALEELRKAHKSSPRDRLFD